MRVSVVIPTYNSGPLVFEAVDSALAQTRPAHEIIVIDDGSTDDTAERIARFGDRVRYLRQANGGVSSARNRGIAEATGELIGFLDADDVWHPRKLEIQVSAMAANPQLGLLGAATFEWPAVAHPIIEGELKPVEIRFEELLAKNRFVTSTVLVRSTAIRDAGEFDRTLQGPEDYDMWLRIARHSNVAVLATPLTGYREATPNSLSKNAVRMENGLLAILGKLESDGAFQGHPRMRRKAWAYFRYSCGLMYRDAGSTGTAINRFVRSLAAWPLRVHPGPNGSTFARMMMLVISMKSYLCSHS